MAQKKFHSPLTGLKILADRIYLNLPPAVRVLVRSLGRRYMKGPLVSPEERLLAELNRPADEHWSEERPPITRQMFMFWRNRPNLVKAFDLERAQDRKRFSLWYRSTETELRCPEKKPDSRQSAPRLNSALPDGINLIGHARAVSGLGEDVRMSIKALEAVKMPFSVFNFHQTVLALGQDPLADPFLAGGLPYNVNLFHMPVHGIVHSFGELGRQAFMGRYNIGLSMWELARGPECWRPAADFMDEFWAPSRFVQEALQGITDRPVHYLPYAVWLPRLPTFSREDFRLPQTRYLFLFLFDFLSYGHRKNPLGSLEAFRKAFPDPGAQAGLVLKTMNGSRSDPLFRELAKAAANDPRIILINEAYSRERVLGLMSVCDAFISLHRSEGFGRALAEAMLLAKPVIATAYSGNADFTRPEHSFPVKFRLIPVGPHQYPHGQGQVWAAPDLDHAAEGMRCLADHPEIGREWGQRAKAFIEIEYSPAAAGHRYQERIIGLGLNRGPSGSSDQGP